MPLPPGVPEWNQLSVDEDDPEFSMVISDESIPDTDVEYEHSQDKPELPTPSGDMGYDHYLNMELSLPRGRDGDQEFAVVKRRAINSKGDPIGRPSTNPLTDNRVYEVQYLNGTIESVSANIIAENLLSQADADGHLHLMLNEIIDHRCNQDAIAKDDTFFTTNNGVKRRKITTKGWELCVQ